MKSEGDVLFNSPADRQRGGIQRPFNYSVSPNSKTSIPQNSVHDMSFGRLFEFLAVLWTNYS